MRHAASVVAERDPRPLARRMQFGAIEECQLAFAGTQKGIERPLAVRRETDFHQPAAAAGTVLEMKEALLRLAVGRRTKERFDRELLPTCDGIHRYDDAIVDAVERERVTRAAVDDAGCA